MEEGLANEIMDPTNNTGASVKKKKICTKWHRNKQNIRSLPLLISFAI